MRTWLVTGGAGYVGGHVVRALRANGDRVVVLDDLSTGDRGRLRTPTSEVPLVVGSVRDRALVRDTLAAHGATGVVHLAGRKRADESLARPDWYREENVGGLRAVLGAMADAGTDRLLYSSSAAVYGDPESLPVDEDASTRPCTPYGQTKLDGERLVEQEVRRRGLRAVALRYFNVAGAARPELADRQPVNLIARVLAALRAGERPVVHGVDHPTPDGTCVRDYVHAEDVADAHVAATALLDGPAAWHVLNVGTGSGWSVREVLDTVAEVTGIPVEPVLGPRRPGDPPAVVAAVDRIAAVAGWRARHPLRSMVASAWSAPTRATAGTTARR